MNEEALAHWGAVVSKKVPQKMHFNFVDVILLHSGQASIFESQAVQEECLNLQDGIDMLPQMSLNN